MNEPNSVPRSELTVVLVGVDGASSIERTMTHLRAQSVRHVMEVIVVVPSEELALFDASARDGFASFRVVVAGPITERGDAAARGIRNARSPIVGLIEDHSFPEAGWAEALIRAHAGPWTGVGPAVENANPAAVMSWVNFILSYGAFSGAVEPGERQILPWHNSAYKVDALAPFASHLGELLAWEGALQHALRDAGHTLYLEPAARTHHLNVSGFASTITLNVQRGRILGAMRSERERWPRWRRIAQACAFPLFPLIQLRHLLPGVSRMAIPRALRPRVLLGLMAALVAMAVGEALGFAFGLGDAVTKLEDYELHRVKHLSRAERIDVARTAGSARSHEEAGVGRAPVSS